MIESLAQVFDRGDDGFAIVKSQEITSEFLDELVSERIASATMRAGETMRAASVPTQVVDVWLAQGIPFWEMSTAAIVDRLEKEGLSAFVTTSKRLH